MNKFLKQKNRGFTLVETLVAISILTMTIVTMMSILGGGIANTNYTKQKIIATYLAQEGIEYVRNVRDTMMLSGDGWEAFKNSSINMNAPLDTTFSRVINKNSINDHEIKVTSSVQWSQGSRTYTVSFSENLFNWIE